LPPAIGAGRRRHGAGHAERPPAGVRAEGAGVAAAATATAGGHAGRTPGPANDSACRRPAAGEGAVSVQQSLHRHLLLGGVSVAVLMGIVFGWGTLSEISGAVIAPGKLVVDSNVKKVQDRKST